MRALAPFALLLLAPALAAADGPQFHVEKMHAPGRILSAHAVDVDGDGHADVVAVFARGTPPAIDRGIAVFYDRGGFRDAPDETVAAPRNAAFVFVADVEGDKAAELVFGGLGGLSASTHAASGWSAPKRVIPLDGMPAIVDDNDLPWLDVARDLDGDGKPELVLPLVDREVVMARAADGSWTRAVELALEPRASWLTQSDVHPPRSRDFAVRIVLSYPMLVTGDYDGDGRKDLLAIVDDKVSVFKGRAPAQGGLFEGTPTAKIRLGVRTEAEAARGNAAVQVTARDLDGDGLVDLAINKVSGGLQSMHSQIGFYRGTGGGFTGPTEVLNFDGFAGSIQFADLDGDGLPELVVPHAVVGFGEAARILFTHKLGVAIEVHKNLGKKGFDPRAATTRSVDFLVDYAGNAELDSTMPTLAGDFNGDGIADFLAPDDKGLAVRLGGGKQLIADKPAATVTVAPTRDADVVDLDGDKRSDVLLYYRFRKGMEGAVVVLRNTGRGW